MSERSGATTGLSRGISLTKLPNHACIMRFADQKNTTSGKRGTLGRQGDRLHVAAARAMSHHIFSRLELDSPTLHDDVKNPAYLCATIASSSSQLRIVAINLISKRGPIMPAGINEKRKSKR